MKQIKKILLVEDNAITLFHLQKVLESSDYEVITTKKAEEVEILLSQHKSSAILMDIMLSGTLTGLDAAEQIRSSSQVPIIFISALTDSQTSRRIEAMTNTALVTKPLDEQELLNTLRHMVIT